MRAPQGSRAFGRIGSAGRALGCADVRTGALGNETEAARRAGQDASGSTCRPCLRAGPGREGEPGWKGGTAIRLDCRCHRLVCVHRSARLTQTPSFFLQRRAQPGRPRSRGSSARAARPSRTWTRSSTWAAAAGAFCATGASSPRTRVFGCDIDPKMVRVVRREPAFCGRHRQRPRRRRSRMPTRSFDLLYAFSVFTHLSEQLQHAWMQECLRVLRPGWFSADVDAGRVLPLAEAADGVGASRLFAAVSSSCCTSAPRARASAAHTIRPTMSGRARRDFELVTFRPAADEGRHDIHLFRKPAMSRAGRAVALSRSLRHTSARALAWLERLAEPTARRGRPLRARAGRLRGASDRLAAGRAAATSTNTSTATSSSSTGIRLLPWSMLFRTPVTPIVAGVAARRRRRRASPSR